MFKEFYVRTRTGKMPPHSLITICLILILTLPALLSTLPSVFAQTVAPNAFMSIVPNPVGINQQLTISTWVQPIAPTSGELMHGFTVIITLPDGSTTTLGPVDSWPHGAADFDYTPTSLGKYKFEFKYPGETYASTGETYLPAESPITEVVVQEDPIAPMPQVPLPNEYFTQPVSTENADWSKILGGWLMCYYNSTYIGFADATGGYNPYSQAPRSAHIMWTKPLAEGGLAGGDSYNWGQYSGASYDARLTPPIIMDGKIYYNLESSKWGHMRRENVPGFVCVDLRTGKELWLSAVGGVDVGQHLRIGGSGAQGVFSYLWDTTGTTWNVFSPFDGSLQFSFENATAGTDWWWEDPVVFGDDGTMFVYVLDGYANTLTMWNSTRALSGTNRNAPGAVLDWKTGIEWTVDVPNRQVDWHVPYSIFGISNGVAIAKTGTGGGVVDYDIAYDINTGKELWVHDKANAVQTFFSTTGEGVFASFDMTTMQWTAYDIRSGAKLWVSDKNQYPFGTYIGYAPVIALGKLFSGSADGYVHAFDLKTGKEVWKAYSGDSGTETVFGHYQFWYGPIIADGVVYAGTGEETPTQPLTRGNRVFALDAETGQQLWNISGYMSLRAIAEGYLLGLNAYDSQAYCFGKGPSAITVEAPMTAVPRGQAVTIRGTVTDQSEGAKQLVASGKFTSVPVTSDASMSQWMEYLYMQKPKPTDPVGVTVKLTATDASGNTQQIGSATTDANGNYALTWNTNVDGQVKITATFDSTASYYGSAQSTYVTVGSGTSAFGLNLGSTESYVIGATVVILIAVGITAVYIRRKIK